jgi:hypothetical protein
VDVTLRHANPRRYPVERIEALVLEQPPPAALTIPKRSGDSATAGVRLFVNGRRMPGRLLLGGGK